MKSNDRIDRNQFMITSLDDMIDKNSNVRVIDAYVQTLDVFVNGDVPVFATFKLTTSFYMC